PAILVLATAGADGAPHARSVVCRRITDAGELWAVSDGRSMKNAQLRERPIAEAVFWLSDLRRQYSIRASVRVDESDRSAMWRELARASRALFHWPSPGEAFDASADFPREIGADAPVPENFTLLKLVPLVVEMLDLNEHP